MGFDEGRIVFDHEDLTYLAGQVVHGKLMFDQAKPKTFRGIYVKIKGECNVHWTTRHSKRVNDRTEHYTVNHNSNEVYFEQKIYLIGGKDSEIHLKPGYHEFPFQCLIPSHCPSSYEGSNGNIRYTFKVIVDRSFKFDQEKIQNIRVINQKDLNREPYCKEPMVFEFEDTYCCWCMSQGSSEVTVHLPQSGYCPGQTINIEVSCANNSNVEISSLQFQLKEHITFRATHEPDKRYDSNVIAKLTKGPIPKNTTRNWTLELDIPQMDLYNVDGCQYIDIDHTFEVTVSPSGCHSDTEATKRFVLGHIPLRELDGPQNPDQIVSQPTAPLQQGFPTFTGNQFVNQTYPGIQHHSNPNQSYNGASSMYNGGNTSYPGSNLPMVSPIPGANPPYPGSNLPMVSPVPGANPPYPGSNTPMVSPIPGGNPSYPGSNLPMVNPGVSPAYPGATPPYPGANPPYPGATSPMPSPFSVPYGSPSEPGFNVAGSDSKDPAGAPLLPVSSVPYPNPPIVSSPLVTASAPEPSTPDFGKIDNPPFNPEMNYGEKK